MTYPEITPAVAVSISECPDIEAYGLSCLHLDDLQGNMAVRLLGSGRSLAYSGDLRAHDFDFTDLLFQLLVRYQGHPDHSGEIGVTDYLAWPMHIRMTLEEIDQFCTEHGKSIRLAFLTKDGARLERERRQTMPSHEPDDGEWADGLTAMRLAMRGGTVARVAAGGRVNGYRGRMPGIAEEVLLSLEARQPVFLIGRFGGCARDIAGTMGLLERAEEGPESWSKNETFLRFTPDDLCNGLSREQNAVLADTPDIDQMVDLVSWGLRRSLTRAAAG